MTQVSNQAIFQKLEEHIKENNAAHKEIMKLFLGNGDIGVLEKNRDQDREIAGIKVQIAELHEKPKVRKNDFKNLSLPKKVGVISTVSALVVSFAYSIGSVFEFIGGILKSLPQ